jgi:hypothetical protein
LGTESPTVLAYRRFTPEETLLVVNNLSDKPQDVAMNRLVEDGEVAISILESSTQKIMTRETTLHLERYQYFWMKID